MPSLQAEQTQLHCTLCALAVAVVLHWTCSSMSMPLSYWGAQNGTAAGVVPGRMEGKDHFTGPVGCIAVSEAWYSVTFLSCR